ncbi:MULTISPECIES: NADH-quinone oxidoreductase subunit NuoK [Streptomyces]|uniref:NADH-quinone oxidoreductase subunit K n=3 Tax=Streptomyces griseus TaxID=1911 RepID=B1VSR3_STRGG|nr:MULTISPECIES: NADH-quinone oxidoreductase subunit K [Streptomyces]MYR14431.1 NADH-quinone oxidoreductase subunit K [Streptomyces sp. SID724]MYR48367.1 NADH-quinone oxidoreductase subunit K [Streptomyces sp. SID4928]EGE40285.1 NADH-ubiquinone oxidoreductase chain 4L [Streptomyces sp. ACT-1]MBW3703271.1 NADH-quinone oxidoreductase subunit K [Streptomyces griseus]SED69802.1 NAD(P)H-quinone oxidoreductase subunit 4L [Streptomyces griseus]
MILEAFLVVAAALFSVGLFGALTQQSVVMLMMGLELMINGIMLAAAAFWYFLAPAPDGQMIVVAVVTAMAIEMAMGFASVTAIYRAKRIDMTDAATELEG